MENASYCQKCGKPILEGHTFCPFCGKKIKLEVYVPQFVDEEEINENNKSTCKCCGLLINEKHITKEGFCIECVMNNKTPIINKFAHPDKNTYEGFRNLYKQLKKKKRRSSVYALGTLAGGLAMMNTSEFDDEIPKNGSFNKNNKKTVYIRSESWVCPCCLKDNSGAHYCTRCGVYPNFKLID